MALKFKVSLVLFLLSLLFGFGGYAIDFALAVIVGIGLFLLSFLTLFYSKKEDTSIVSILMKAILFGL